MDEQTEQKCVSCGVMGTFVPGYSFSSLEGSPLLCEQCIVRQFGLDIPWSEKIKTFLRKETA